MSVKKFDIHIGDQKIAVFVYDNFFEYGRATSPLHSHRYSEIHFTERGECRIYANGEEFISRAGTVTAIPAGCVHRLNEVEKDTVHNAFMISAPLCSIKQKTFEKHLLEELGEAVRVRGRCGDFQNIAAYLAFLCKDIIASKTELRQVDDYEFIIYEFFANRYNQDIGLSDLADALQLCTRQAARVLEKYTGESFSKALSRYRINAAKLLMEANPELSLSEISQMVGYRSYSGFWKAFKAFE